MRRFVLLAGFASLSWLLLCCPNTDAVGRGGGGGAGKSAGGGGGGVRPAAHAPSNAPSMARPSAPAQAPARPTPSINPGNAKKPNVSPPNIKPPVTVGKLPTPPAVKAPQVKTPEIKPPVLKPNVPQPGINAGLKLPGNSGIPNQLPANRPEVTRPGNLAQAGKVPDLGKGQSPDFGKGKGVDLKGKADIGDLQKKNPGVFDRPKDGGLAGKGASKDDVSGWLGVPKDRPGNDRGPVVDRPDRDRVKNDFNNNWKQAIGGDNVNIGNKKVGDINVDLSKNNNYLNLSNNARVVNNNFRSVQGNTFNQGWWDNQRHDWPSWHYHNYARPASYWWRPCAWGTMTAFMVGAAWSPPVYYDYGSNVVMQDDVVYVNEQPVASAPVYAQQAIDLATVETPPADATVEWLPLGTFALSSDKDDSNPNTILQLALSKDGVVSGVWLNRKTEASADVEGRVNPETQRLALRKPDQPDVVLEVGVYNLSQAASPCLIHFGTTRSQTWYLTRLEAQE
jgi:hypothetical protein